MKYLLLTVLTLAIIAAPVAGQAKKRKRDNAKEKIPAVKSAVPVVYDDVPPPPVVVKKANAPKLTSDNLILTLIGEGGAASVLIPEDLTDVSNSNEKQTNKNVSWTAFARYWKQPNVFAPNAFEVSVHVTTWNNPTKEIVPELRPDLATPEHLILLDLLGDLRQKNTPDSPVKEAKAMDVDGINGAYFFAEYPPPAKRFLTGWQTHLYYQGKPQQISVTVTGDISEANKALRIIQSLKIKSVE